MNNEEQIFPTDLSQYAEAVSAIKEAITRCRYRSLAAANSNVLSLYFGVGRYVSQNSRDGKWGQKAIPTISALLQKEMPGLRGFSVVNIKRMRTFYEEWAEVLNRPLLTDEIRPTVLDELGNEEISPLPMGETGSTQIRPSATDELQVNENLLLTSIFQPRGTDFNWSDFVKISFTHHYEILVNAKTLEARLFYIHQTAIHSWPVATLKVFCKEKLYENRSSMPSNFTQTLPDAKYAAKAVLAFKDEYLLDMLNVENVGEREEDWNERVIENQIVRDIRDFILRFGVDFTFVGSQHRLVVEGEEMLADLVFFNRELNASVIVELKRGRFRPNYLGQLSAYLAAYDLLEKKPHENPSIGIILCHDANRRFVEFLVRTYDQPMGVATYRTSEEMPERLRRALPDMERMKQLMNEAEKE